MQIQRALMLLAAVVLFTPGCAIDRSARTAGPRLGAWELTGKDRSEWRALMVFTKREGTQYEGYLKWRDLDGSAGGREQFRGAFSPSTGRVTLKGFDMRERRGDIATGSTYEAVVSGDGRALRDGRWFGKNVEPGTWSAVWKNTETPKP